MKGSKVYVLMETDYNTEGDTAVISEILSVCEDLEHAKKVMQEEMQRNIEDFEFVSDSDNEGKELSKILFWNYEENWDNYIEFNIIEKEIE